jgi:hypothetical protein
MGGLSAVISVLRLVGGDLVQSVLGRQHENRAEAILDVSSASVSVVGQQFSDGNIASVLVPDPQREAWFILRGSTVLREPSIRPDPLSLEHRQGNIQQIYTTKHTATTISQLLGRCEKAALTTLGIAVYPVLRTQDDNAISYNGKVNNEISRKLFMNGKLATGNILHEASEIAAQRFRLVRAIGRSTYRDGGTPNPTPTASNPVNRTALGFEMRFKDVSTALTLSEPRSPKLFAFGALGASGLLYCAFLLKIYFGNRNEALVSVLFALIGQTVVVVGMIARVWTIDDATIECCIILPPVRELLHSQAHHNLKLDIFLPIKKNIHIQGAEISLWKIRNGELVENHCYGQCGGSDGGFCVYIFRTTPVAMVDGGHISAVTVCAISGSFCKVLICAAISGVSAIIRSVISGKCSPDPRTNIQSGSGFCLSFDNPLASFGFAPIISPTTKLKKSECEQKDELEEPFESWDELGPWGLKCGHPSS